MSIDPATDPLPFSVTVNVRKLSKKGEHHSFSADETQRKAIAQRYGLTAVHAFTATAHATPWRKGGVRVVGKVEARYI